MADTTDDAMDQPVTRRELKEELEAKLANYPTKAELQAQLELVVGALVERMNAMGRSINEQMNAMGRSMVEQMRAMEDRLMVELGRHSVANAESLRKDIAVVDERYADLPDRVARLEQTIAAPKRRKR